jgi:hypothetical protein
MKSSRLVRRSNAARLWPSSTLPNSPRKACSGEHWMGSGFPGLVAEI